jgi:hypothetical protein
MFGYVILRTTNSKTNLAESFTDFSRCMDIALPCHYYSYTVYDIIDMAELYIL